MGPSFEDLLDNVNAILEHIPFEQRGMSFERVVEGIGFQENTRRLELALALAWAARNAENSDNLLTHLLHGHTIAGKQPDLRARYLPKTQREWEVACLVAATVVQWLGTSAGCAFLGRAFQSAGGKLAVTLPDTTGYEPAQR